MRIRQRLAARPLFFLAEKLQGLGARYKERGSKGAYP